MIAICHRPNSVATPRPRRGSLADQATLAPKKAPSTNGSKPARKAVAKKSARLASAVRVRSLLKQRIEFIDNPQFEQPDAEQQILAGPDVTLERIATDLPSAALEPTNTYLARLYDSRLLDPEEETALFRKMNFLKFQAHATRETIDPQSAELRLVSRVEQLLGAARDVEAQIVRANLRLVVSIAKKFAGPACTFEDLVSDGNMALIRAVDKFDFDRGNRFSTYATYAIRRSLYRLLMKDRQVRTRYVSDDKALQAVPDESLTPELSETQLHGLQVSFGQMIQKLDPRERQVIVARFGLDGEDPKTFRVLGEELGVCKERIRQLQARALQKLKDFGGRDLSRLLDQ